MTRWQRIRSEHRFQRSKEVGHRLAVAVLTAVSVALPAAELRHRYSFSADASDSVGSAHGTLRGGANIVNGAVVLNGTSAYVDLPNGLVATLTNATFEVWLVDQGSGIWARIFDFGSSSGGEDVPLTGTSYLFLTPRSGAGTLRAAITLGGSGGEQQLDWLATPLPVGRLVHVVWTLDAAAQTGRLYVDGALVAESAGMGFYPALLGLTVNNWLGRSQWIADPYLNGSITEFRIYGDVLNPDEVRLSFENGPDLCLWDGPVTILHEPQDQTVMESAVAQFKVTYAGRPPVRLQWYQNGVPLPGAVQDTLVVAPVTVAHHGVQFHVALTNSHGGQTRWAVSRTARLHVVADTNPPVLLRAQSLFPNKVIVLFSEALRPDTATNLAHYAITSATGVLPVQQVEFGDSGSVLILRTAPQTEGETYTLNVHGVRDLAAAANLIAPDSRATFIATAYVQANVGLSPLEGAFVPVSGGFDLSAPAGGVGGNRDAFVYGWRLMTNDFDLQVRLDALGYDGAWTRAGLMARDGLTSNAPFAATVATPGPAGCHFQWRSTAGANANMTGLFPLNGPYTWLRLRRSANLFTGLASMDGEHWEHLGSVTLSVSNVLHVGLILAGGSTSGGATARFRDLNAGHGTVWTNLAVPFEPPGPSSRRTALVITEIMYNPPGSWPGGDGLEFIEVWNSGLVTEDLTGHALDGDIQYRFPDGTRIAPSEYLLVARDPQAARSFYGVDFLGPFRGPLPNGRGTVRLLNELGGILLEVPYQTRDPWPIAPDGTGHSLVLTRPSYGEADPRAWSASDRIGGSPGHFDAMGPEPARGVVINEILAAPAPPQEDFVELFNNTARAIDLSGAWLSDRGDPPRYRIPDGTVVPARGWLVIPESQLGFGLSAEGERLFLINSNRTRVLDAIVFGGQARGISWGRSPDGQSRFRELSALSPGTTNAPPMVRPVVINEIMYHPISGADEDEYIELHNRGTNVISLAGWRLEEAVQFTFPTGATLWPGGYVVVAKNASNLIARYPQLNATNTFGDYTGRLRNSSDRIVLSMPEIRVSTNTWGQAVTNRWYVLVNDVTYYDGGRWGRWSDGWGSSLELIDPRADNTLPDAWADSDESAKAPWTYIDVTHVLENGQTPAMINQGTYYGRPTRLEIFLQGPGEVLIDNVAFVNNSGPNLIANGTFEAGSSGWIFQGVCRGSLVESGVGPDGSRALRLVAAARGDTGPNKVWTSLTGTVLTNPPNTGTLRAAVRWLRGSPYIVFRLSGQWMEVPQRLRLPETCGTPGLPNSRRIPNAGPAIGEVQPNPILPAAGQPVLVTAQITDPDGISQVLLRFRQDPDLTFQSVAMRDDGSGGDRFAGDGIYTATLSGRAANSLVAFHIRATDNRGAMAQYPSDAPLRECLVRWGENPIAGSLGTYRLWLTASNIQFWTARERNANDPIDATFVYGNYRVLYNAATLYSGSPFHTPNYNGPTGSFACDYEVNFSPHDKLLGSEAFVLTAFDVASGNFFHNDPTAQVDLTGNWIARKLGQQYNHQRHVHVVVNGLRRGTIYSDVQQPNSEMLDQYFPNDQQGQLRKIEDWFEFADDGQNLGITTATLTRHNRTDGSVDTKRYRWNWRPRVTRNPEDWSPFIHWLTVANDVSAADYVTRLGAWMDLRRCLRVIAVHHIVGNWDSYGYERGKNMYAYKPDGLPWRFLLWDIELALGYQSRPANHSIYVIHDPTLRFLITNWPVIHREYLAAFHEAVQTVLVPGMADGPLDERYASFQQNNLPLQSPQGIKNYLASRRAYLQTILPAAGFAMHQSGLLTVTGSNTIALTGSAPLEVDQILINGTPYPVTWSSITNWQVLVPLSVGTNRLTVTARDRHGRLLPQAQANATVVHLGDWVEPEGWVVLHEILHAPPVPGAAFIELHNAHSNRTFDLSGWRIDGVDYTFPPGTLLGPKAYLVLAKDLYAFMDAFGPGVVPFDYFAGELDPEGETLTLLRPVPGSTNAWVVDRVRYEAQPPWPLASAGASLQLVDPLQDNSRVANWGIGLPRTSAPPAHILLMDYSHAWRYMQVSNLNNIAWQAPGYNDTSWPTGPGLLGFENNSALTPLIRTVLKDPRIGTNGMSSGHAYYFRARITVPHSLAGYLVTGSAYIDDGAVFYLNGAEIARIRMNPGSVSNATLATGPPAGAGGDATTPETFTLPGDWFQAGTNVLAVSVHQATANSSDVLFGLRLEAVPTQTVPLHPYACTPGMPNSVTTNLPPFPPLWLNELQAENLTGPMDSHQQREPWVELYNAGSNPVSLAGCYLSDTLTNLMRWAFPGQSMVPPRGFLLIWCDGQPEQSVSNVFHASFRLVPNQGSVYLSRLIDGQIQILDYLHYRSLPANWSYGAVPDGQPFDRRVLFMPTPGATNNGLAPPVAVHINEWMADNVTALADPADGNFEDWFELYNAGTNAVDLGGFTLTDDLNNPTRYRVPANGQYVVPPGGYLLVWADNEPNQNAASRSDLHVNFALSRAGESIGLFAPDGSLIDAVTFGPQQPDVSQGRIPDGAANIRFMPPTPRAQNVLSNSPPSIEPLDMRLLTLGQTLTVSVTARDPDAPLQTIVFALAPGSPAGAHIHPVTGWLQWTPPFAPATNEIVIQVTDNGLPSMSATQVLTVIVAPPPRVGHVSVQGDLLHCAWQVFPGQRIQVEWSDDLTAASWQSMGPVITNQATSLPFTYPVDPDVPRRFFRLRVLEP
ncbi:MAG: lamin tail domain-containing protein [Verrucomicrobiota bacterium]|nr:lamin tail domain-containing protein [Limisphaera sp.]MDW8381129.1 lamin tail domain-containing protein [Verrucomicrobiota bacterium]